MEKRFLKQTMKGLEVTQAVLVEEIREHTGDKYLTKQSTFSLWLAGKRRKKGWPWAVVQVILARLRRAGMTKAQEEKVLNELGFSGVMLETSPCKTA